MIEHELRTKNKQLVSKLYSFNKIRIKENVTQELVAIVKLSERSFEIIFNVIDCVKDVFLRYS